MLEYKNLLNPNGIWSIEQNKPSLVVDDLEKFGVPRSESYAILLARGIFKWLAVRRDLIKLKNIWRDKLTEAYRAQETDKTEWRKGYIAALEECRKEVRSLCHSERFRAPDFDRKANEYLRHITSQCTRIATAPAQQPARASKESGNSGSVGYPQSCDFSVLRMVKMDEKMLTRAMRKAVALGVFPKMADGQTYLRNWSAMEEILKAALSVEQVNAAELLPSGASKGDVPLPPKANVTEYNKPVIG